MAQTYLSIALQHALNKVTKWSPEILACTRETVFINKQDVMLEAGVQMRFEAQLNDDGVVMTVDVRIDTIESLEDVS